jgi:predicted nucleic acid-binding protein
MATSSLEQRIAALEHAPSRMGHHFAERESGGCVFEIAPEKLRLGSQDLRIAAIAISEDALLLSANLSDFEQVAGLRVANWLRG